MIKVLKIRENRKAKSGKGKGERLKMLKRFAVTLHRVKGKGER
jgi:hypothetical protein